MTDRFDSQAREIFATIDRGKDGAHSLTAATLRQADANARDLSGLPANVREAAERIRPLHGTDALILARYVLTGES